MGNHINSKWFEECIRKFINKPTGEILQEDFEKIKYMYVATTHEMTLGFSMLSVPKFDSFSNAGDEWWDMCLDDTSRFSKIEDFLDISTNTIELKEDIKEAFTYDRCEELSKEEMKELKEFEESVVYYSAKKIDYENLREEDDDDDTGILNSDDFKLLNGIEVIRFMDCETEIHDIDFINYLPKLRILELGNMRIYNNGELGKLKELEKLCIWP